MSEEKDLKLPSDLKSVEPAKIKGWTLREVRHRRALVLLQKEFCKEKVSYDLLKIRNSSPFSKNFSGRTKPLGRAGAIASRLIQGMNYVDYALIGYSMFSNVRKLTSIFRKKKK